MEGADRESQGRPISNPRSGWAEIATNTRNRARPARAAPLGPAATICVRTVVAMAARASYSYFRRPRRGREGREAVQSPAARCVDALRGALWFGGVVVACARSAQTSSRLPP